MEIAVQKAVFSLVITLLLMGVYMFYIFGIHGSLYFPQVTEIQFWGRFILKLAGVMVVGKIVLFILFAIFRALKNEHEDIENPDFMDERDKLIEMKSERYSNWISMFGFIAAMMPISMGYSLQYMFITLLSFGFVSVVMSEVLKIYFYKRRLP